MPTGLGTYSFLPWVRSGLSAWFPTSASTAPTGQRRVGLTVTLQVAKGRTQAVATQVPVNVAVQLYGPGDIVGIDPQEVIRIEPAPGASQFEPNHLPFVEFDTPELPWLFSPLPTPAAGTQSRLRPWLCLVVVRKGPGAALAPAMSGPVAVLDLPNAAELPNLDDSWAWAHAQVLRAGDTVDDVLAAAPVRTLARLLCPRRLEPDTAYLACVVPTLEAGRQAGLGLEVTATDQPAWPRADPARPAVRLPVYHHWEFTTGPADDFEALARRLRPNPLPAEFGAHIVDVSAPGRGFPPVGTSLAFDGALLPAGRVPASWPADAQGTTFQDALRQRLGAPAGRHAEVVTPPIYGGGHAGFPSALPVPGSPPLWLAELNLDPRHRAVAAVGAHVVQEHQEQLVASAWEQLGDIALANQLLHNSQLALAVAQRHCEKRFQELPPEAVVQVTGPAHARVRWGGHTVDKLVRDTALPESAASASFRKLTRPAGPLARRAAARTADAVVRRLVVDLSNAAVSLPLAARAAGAVAMDQVSAQVGTPAITYAAALPATIQAATGWYWIDELLQWIGVPPAVTAAPTSQVAALMEPVPEPNGTGETDPIRRVRLGGMRTRFRQAAGAHQAHLRVGVPAPPPPPPAAPLGLGTLKAELTAPGGQLDPARTIPAQLRDRLPALAQGDGAEAGPAGLATLVAAPSFPQAMAEQLCALAPDRLLPGLAHVPPDTAALLDPNPQFVEAYMAGLNHELSRELLWRGVPTDQRATYFRCFWTPRPAGDATAAEGADVGRAALLAPEATGTIRLSAYYQYLARGATPGRALDDWLAAEQELEDRIRRRAYFLYLARGRGPGRALDDWLQAEQELAGVVPEPQPGDVPPLHRWAGALGEHAGGTGLLVLLLRGELLRRYPSAAILAARAATRTTLCDPATATPGAPCELLPTFRFALPPDTVCVGFPLTPTEAVGSPTDPTQPGWFFVVQPQPTAPRFGLDAVPTQGGQPVYGGRPTTRWRQLSWAHVATSAASFAALTHLPVSAPFGALTLEGATYGLNAAHMARIALRQPARIAIHAAALVAS